MRPNIGITGGGVFVFDDTAWFHMETPYYINYWNSPLPEERDLRDFTFSSGQRIRDARTAAAVPAQVRRP